MLGILLSAIAILIVSCIVGGFNLATVLAITGTIMFCGRKFRYYAKIEHLITLEVLGLFLTVMVALIFKRFDLTQTIVYCVLRVIYLGICTYEIKQYVYVDKKYHVSNKERE